MIRVAQAQMMDIATAAARATRFFSRFRLRLARAETAMAGQARLAALHPETQRDTGLAPEDLADAPSHDPALPFFMQANFGHRDR